MKCILLENASLEKNLENILLDNNFGEQNEEHFIGACFPGEQTGELFWVIFLENRIENILLKNVFLEK